MKSVCINTYLAVALTLASTVASLLVIPAPQATSISHRRNLNHHQQQQHLRFPNDMTDKDPKIPGPIVKTDGPIMSDAMAIQRDVSIFAELVRGSESVSHRLEDTMQNTTVLAPLNSVVKDLPRKPWEDPAGADEFHGQAGEDRAARNLERFVEAHVVPVSPWEEKLKVKTLGGREIWWETNGDYMVINPGSIKVRKVASSVQNGQIWTVEGVINY